MPQWKMVGIAEMLLGYKASYNLSTGSINGSVTSFDVGAGQGANFAAATTNNPIEILIDSEVMAVTGRAVDTLTVIRAQNGTAGASHTAGTGNVKSILEVQMPFTHQFAINPQTTEITFAGDGDQEYVSLHLGMRGTIQADKWLTTIWEKILGVTAESSNLPSDEVTRWYPDAGNYPALRLRCIMHAIDDDTGLDVSVRLEVPKAQIYPRPWHPGAVGSAAKQMQDLAWTAQRTKTDLLGATLPGSLPSRGVFFMLAQLSTPLP